MKKDKQYYFKIILLFIILIVSDDTVLFGTNAASGIFIIKMGILISVLIVMLINMHMNNIKFKDSHIGLLLILYFGILLTALINRDLGRFAYYYRMLYITLAFIMVQVITIDEFFLLFDKIMRFLSIFSIVTFVMEVLSVNIYRQAPILINISNNGFYNLLFSVVRVQNWGVPRNYGIFREPGVFQVFIILALIIHIFSENMTNLYTILIYSVALLTTRSTTGYLALIVLFIVYTLYNTQNTKEILTKLTFIATFILMGYYLLMETEILISSGYGSVFGKFVNSFESGSSDTRIGSITTNVLMFYQNPLTGIGVSKVESYHTELMTRLYGIVSYDNTNHLLVPYSTFGIFFGTIMIVGYYKFTRLVNSNRLISLGTFIVICITLIGSNLPNNIIIFSLVFYGYFYRLQSRNRTNIKLTKIN